MPWPYRSAQAVKIQGGTVPVKPDKQALLDGVKAAYTQAKQNADAAAAAAEDVANAMKQLEDDEELALLRTDNKAAIKALTAEEAKNALNMLHPDTLDTAAAPMGNLKVMPTDILPLALCDQDWVDEMGKVIMADGRPFSPRTSTISWCPSACGGPSRASPSSRASLRRARCRGRPSRTTTATSSAGPSLPSPCSPRRSRTSPS
mmetsp:Transcript_41548/g.135214  ORF Transcript_41548/g.135214 Transcript_41548/m.135214 type:complete len:204 (-) Transcript_41548:684-1295(-)